MQMRYEGHFEVARFKRCDATLEKCRLSTPHDTRSEIHQICAIANDDRGRRTRRCARGK